MVCNFGILELLSILSSTHFLIDLYLIHIIQITPELNYGDIPIIKKI